MAKTVQDAYSGILRLRNEFYQKWQETSQYDDNRGAYKAKYEAFDKALELLTPCIVDERPEPISPADVGFEALGKAWDKESKIDSGELGHSATKTSDQEKSVNGYVLGGVKSGKSWLMHPESVPHTEDPESESLEEAYRKYADHQVERIYPNLSPSLPRESRMALNVFNGADLEMAFEGGSIWKEQKVKDNIIRLLDEAYEHGRYDMKQQMAKDVTEG